MRLIHSHEVRAGVRDEKIARVIETIRIDGLRHWVERLAAPRHVLAEPQRNHQTGDWIADLLRDFGYSVELRGEFRNVIALPKTAPSQLILVAAHYDSVPGCPGADDNASAVAAMLGCAWACSIVRPAPPVGFVAFNREEDGMIGSRDFVQSFLPGAPFRVSCAHILEMVGYASTAPGSQRIPTGLPIKLRDTGDFLGLLANARSGQFMKHALGSSVTYLPHLPVTALEVPPGAELLLPVLARSDHAPFWRANIPAVMWTDTAEFRNPNYHRQTDTPDTLDYHFLHAVTSALTAAVLAKLQR